MHRRAVLAAVPGLLAASGCLSSPPAGSSGTEPPTERPSRTEKPSNARWTPIRRTADGVEATFEILDAHAPTDETAAATAEDGRVVVTGNVFPHGCRHPVLDSAGYDQGSGTVRLVIGTEATYGETATVECDAASYDYRTVVTVEEGPPSRVEVVHDGDERDDRTFTVEL